MATLYENFARRQSLGILSTASGVLGLVLFWWAPAGIVLGLCGLVLGLVGGLRVRREVGGRTWVVVGVVVSLAAVVLGILAATYGWAPVQLTSYQG